MMEMEQMMECLLARMDASMVELEERMDIKQATDRKANQDELKAIMNDFQRPAWRN
jgi:hypothetical protein